MTSYLRYFSIRYLYNKIIEAASTPKAFFVCCLISFAESSFFPLPPDIMMIPMGIANRQILFRLAFFLTIFSVLGGFLGYAIGYFLFQSIGQWIIETYHLQSALTKFQHDFATYGFWIISLKGLTPIPYKLVTIASGVAHFDFFYFTLASIIARSFRFYLLAFLIWYFGPMAKPYIEKYLGLLLVIILGTLAVGFLLIKWIYA